MQRHHSSSSSGSPMHRIGQREDDDNMFLSNENRALEKQPARSLNKLDTGFAIASRIHRHFASDLASSAISSPPLESITSSPPRTFSPLGSFSSSDTPTLPSQSPRLPISSSPNASVKSRSSPLSNAQETYGCFAMPPSFGYRPHAEDAPSHEPYVACKSPRSFSKRFKKAIKGIFGKHHHNEEDILYVECRHWTEL